MHRCSAGVTFMGYLTRYESDLQFALKWIRQFRLNEDISAALPLWISACGDCAWEDATIGYDTSVGLLLEILKFGGCARLILNESYRDTIMYRALLPESAIPIECLLASTNPERFALTHWLTRPEKPALDSIHTAVMTALEHDHWNEPPPQYAPAYRARGIEADSNGNSDGEGESDGDSVAVRLIQRSSVDYLHTTRIRGGRVWNAMKLAVRHDRADALRLLVEREPTGFHDLVDPTDPQSPVEPYEFCRPNHGPAILSLIERMTLSRAVYYHAVPGVLSSALCDELVLLLPDLVSIVVEYAAAIPHSSCALTPTNRTA